MTPEERESIIGNLCASIYVVSNCLDMEMSTIILKETTKKYGEKECGEIMEQILDVMGGKPVEDAVLSRWVNAINFGCFQVKNRKEEAYEVSH